MRADGTCGLLVVLFDIEADGLFKVGGAGEDVAPELVFSEIAEEALHPVEPTAGCGREVEVKSWMLLGACLDFRSLCVAYL